MCVIEPCPGFPEIPAAVFARDAIFLRGINSGATPLRAGVLRVQMNYISMCRVSRIHIGVPIEIDGPLGRLIN